MPTDATDATALAPGRILPNEIIDKIFSYYSLLSRDPDDGFHRGPDKVTENLALTMQKLGRVLFFYARARLFEYIHVGSQKRVDKLLLALERSIRTRDGNGQIVQLDGYLKRLVHGLRIEIREPGDEAWSGLTPANVKALGAALPGLTILDIDLSDKGAYLTPSLIKAFRSFPDVEQLELMASSPVGFENVKHVCFAFERLQSLKLQSVDPGWTTASAKDFREGRTMSASPPPANFGKHLSTLVLWDCTLAASELDYLLGALDPAILENLTLHHLQSKGVGTPVPYPLVPAQLLPFTPTLRSFHLVLFDRAAIPNNVVRYALNASGALKDGRLTTDPRTLPTTFLLDALASSFTTSLASLSIGGSLALTPSFFSTLPSLNLSRLELWSCANLDRPPVVDGLTPLEFISALDLEWAKQLQELKLKGMAEVTYKDGPAWDWEAIGKIEEKLAEVGGKAGIHFEHDVREPVPVRKNEKSKRKKDSMDHAFGGMSSRQKKNARRVGLK